MSEQLNEKDFSLTEMVQKYEFEKKQWNDLESKLKSENANADWDSTEMTKKYEALKLELEEVGV